MYLQTLQRNLDSHLMLFTFVFVISDPFPDSDTEICYLLQRLFRPYRFFVLFGTELP